MASSPQSRSLRREREEVAKRGRKALGLDVESGAVAHVFKTRSGRGRQITEVAARLVYRVSAKTKPKKLGVRT